MTLLRLLAACLSLAAMSLPPTAVAETSVANAGVVIMHGKGGSPAKHVAELAAALEARGLAVANLEMPWSGRRDYDVDVAAAESEVEAALTGLRQKGARKLFIAGHSQGGLFALHVGGRLAVDGVIAIAPGGNVASPLFREKLGESVELARKLVAEGRTERTRFYDFESSRGTFPVVVAPAAYLSWFDPDGAMNQAVAVRNIKPNLPVLLIVPTGDYPGLLKVKQQTFEALPRNPHTRLYEPSASHIQAPSAAIAEIIVWLEAVAAAQ